MFQLLIGLIQSRDNRGRYVLLSMALWLWAGRAVERFLPRSAMLEREIDIGGVSVRLSATRWYWLKTNDRRITQFSAPID